MELSGRKVVVTDHEEDGTFYCATFLQFWLDVGGKALVEDPQGEIQIISFSDFYFLDCEDTSVSSSLLERLKVENENLRNELKSLNRIIQRAGLEP